MGSKNSTFPKDYAGRGVGHWFVPDPLTQHKNKMNSWKYSEKFCNKYGADYRGKINWTKSGGICQN